LQARGLDDGAIEAAGYRSAPSARYGESIARALSSHDLRGVPGFYCAGGEWRLVDFGPGILIPARDERGRVQALQLRRDAGLSPRYLWLSSGSKPHGTGSKAPIHYAKRHLLTSAQSVLLTEGALKADVIAHFLNRPVIANHNISYPQDFAAQLQINFPQLKTCIIAFDSDFRTNAAVKNGLTNLKAQLVKAGLRATVRVWPRAYKGLDDYLLAGHAESQNSEKAQCFPCTIQCLAPQTERIAF